MAKDKDKDDTTDRGPGRAALRGMAAAADLLRMLPMADPDAILRKVEVVLDALNICARGLVLDGRHVEAEEARQLIKRISELLVIHGAELATEVARSAELLRQSRSGRTD